MELLAIVVVAVELVEVVLLEKEDKDVEEGDFESLERK